MHPVLHLLTLAIVLGMLGAAAVTDLRSGLIPNGLVATGAAAGVTVQLLAAGLGYVSWGSALGNLALGLFVCSIAPGLLYRLGALGGGDLKLFAAIGLCVGPSVGLDIQLGAVLLAALYAPLCFARNGRLAASPRRIWSLLRNLWLPAARRTQLAAAEMTSLRFAPAIFLAAVWVAWVGP